MPREISLVVSHLGEKQHILYEADTRQLREASPPAWFRGVCVCVCVFASGRTQAFQGMCSWTAANLALNFTQPPDPLTVLMVNPSLPVELFATYYCLQVPYLVKGRCYLTAVVVVVVVLHDLVYDLQGEHGEERSDVFTAPLQAIVLSAGLDCDLYGGSWKCGGKTNSQILFRR